MQPIKQKSTADKQNKLKVIKHATTENIISQRKRVREMKGTNKFPETKEQFSKYSQMSIY